MYLYAALVCCARPWHARCVFYILAAVHTAKYNWLRGAVLVVRRGLVIGPSLIHLKNSFAGRDKGQLMMFPSQG